jgi:membrane protein DedA with SNARE-associated domain
VVFLQSILNFFGEYWAALQNGQLPPLGYWNYLILMVFVIIQGPFVTLLSGAGVAAGLFNPILAMTTSVIGSLIADVFWYNVGLLGKLERYFKSRSGKRKKMVELLQKAMQKHYLKVLLFGKLSLGLAIPAVISAGLCRIKWRRWFPVVIVGEFIFTGMLVLLGYFATESILHVDKIVKVVGITTTVICLILLSVVIPIEMRKMITRDSIGTE